MSMRMKISKGGQVSIPAPIRHRWGTSMVTLEDEGSRIILQPAADDPIAAADARLPRSSESSTSRGSGAGHEKTSVKPNVTAAGDAA